MPMKQKYQFTPSWRRELLVPILKTLPSAMLLTGPLLAPKSWVSFLFIAAALVYFVTAALRQDIVIPALALNRPNASPSPADEPTRLEKVLDHTLPPDKEELIQKQLFLPEITTAPTWLQWLIAYLGWPLFDTNNPTKISYWLHRVIGWLFLLALVPFAFFVTAALRSDTQMAMFEPASAKWSLIGGLVLAFLILRYRQCLVRLHNVYVEDAKTTGRAPFPALRR